MGTENKPWNPAEDIRPAESAREKIERFGRNTLKLMPFLIGGSAAAAEISGADLLKFEIVWGAMESQHYGMNFMPEKVKAEAGKKTFDGQFNLTTSFEDFINQSPKLQSEVKQIKEGEKKPNTEFDKIVNEAVNDINRILEKYDKKKISQEMSAHIKIYLGTLKALVTHSRKEPVYYTDSDNQEQEILIADSPYDSQGFRQAAEEEYYRTFAKYFDQDVAAKIVNEILEADAQASVLGAEEKMSKQ
ncbi:MAG: hypothetical protein CEN91_11 [Candidatus Berkelbacteria bacterium Licking1014_85]|uniref:Uncharacterized protein n=1 Tax=Candidatus Berkelbacteria bacterium Licking1014_85 TaxID=2017148 RepID=A0A554LMT3_9BACT|nr:MAG: hypothetical protein CEN91_11 [Candidatus Berkelbacteria bacterium Licking1014_85]